MTCFRTVLKLEEAVSIPMIWEKICQWQMGSDTPSEARRWFTERRGSPVSVQRDFPGGGRRLAVELIVLEDSLAFRLEDVQENRETITCVVASLKGREPLLSYELEVNGQANPGRDDFSKPPFLDFISDLLKRDRYPCVPCDSQDLDLETISAIMRGEKTLQQPLVYISMNDTDGYDVSPQQVARRLQYLAFVVGESDRVSSSQLKRLAPQHKPFNGYVGVYWKKTHRIFLATDEDVLFREVTRRLALNRLPDDLAWLNVKDRWFNRMLQGQSEGDGAEQKDRMRLLESQLQELQRENKRLESDNQNFVREFDEENERLRKIEGQLREENERLRRQLEGGRDSGGSLVTIQVNCSEQSLFPEEIPNFIKGIIWQYIVKHGETTEKSRHTDILSVLREENPSFDFDKSESARRFTSAVEQIKRNEPKIDSYELVESKRGSHRKYVFCDDQRYKLVMPKTSSDKRGYENAASDARKHFLEPRK